MLIINNIALRLKVTSEEKIRIINNLLYFCTYIAILSGYLANIFGESINAAQAGVGALGLDQDEAVWIDVGVFRRLLAGIGFIKDVADVDTINAASRSVNI